MLLQQPRQWPLERQGSRSLSHPPSPHFEPTRPQHECCRLKPPGLDGSPSSKIAVSLSLSFPLVFSFARSSPSLLLVGDSVFSLSGRFMDREVSSSWSEGTEQRLESERGCGWLGVWGLTVGLLVRQPLGDAVEAVDPGPRRFLTWAYRLPSRGPLVWEISVETRRGVIWWYVY